MGILRYLRGRFGRYVDRKLGYSLRVGYKDFPGMDIQYVEGPRAMHVFGELMANLKDIDVHLRTFGGWEPPHHAEPIDLAHKRLVQERIASALAHMGLIVRWIGRFD